MKIKVFRFFSKIRILKRDSFIWDLTKNQDLLLLELDILDLLLSKYAILPGIHRHIPRMYGLKKNNSNNFLVY